MSAYCWVQRVDNQVVATVLPHVRLVLHVSQARVVVLQPVSSTCLYPPACSETSKMRAAVMLRQQAYETSGGARPGAVSYIWDGVCAELQTPARDHS